MTVTEDVPVVAVAGLRRSYGDGRTVEAVRDLTFTVGAGELTWLVGPSGDVRVQIQRAKSASLP